MRPLLAVGLLCLGAGIVLVAGPTFALSVVESDRGMSVGLSEERGLLGTVESEETVGPDGETTVFALVNHAGEPIEELDARVEPPDGPVGIATEFDSPPIAPGERTELSLECEREARGDEDGTGAFTVVVDRAATESVVIESVSRTVEFEYECGDRQGPPDGAGSGNEEIGSDGPLERFTDVDAAARERTGAIDVELTALEDVVVEGLAVETTAEATAIGDGPDSEAVLRDDGNEVRGEVRVPPAEPHQWELGTDERFDEEVSIDAGETVTLELRVFEDEDGPVPLDGETVEVTLYVDGGHQTVDVTV
jgi:hypothetical protein